ncbi:hypothetical protein AJ80_00361 [Polytolypa hystricis UAMH7299]|uniref:Uncharacterized protein n=1 Tax=Polytolypa hystricis (strain UAMH7299) TaxID=1447883 RepID=A0A2B7Z4D9_POLH7|nr:hypothetical protein AJ80_00361 [Polytolypa hystricis UAMH7299]
MEEVYPPELDNVLSNLTLFSNLEKITVDFPFDYDENIVFDDPLVVGLQEVAIIESEDSWRELMAASFRAIARNSPENLAQLSSLTIRNLNPVAVSTFSTETFHNFLSRLKSFNLSVRWWNNGVGWNLNTIDTSKNFLIT